MRLKPNHSVNSDAQLRCAALRWVPVTQAVQWLITMEE